MTTLIRPGHDEPVTPVAGSQPRGAAPRAPQQPPPDHPRTVGWFGVTALAMGGSNQSLFLLAALVAAQGSAAVPLLIAGLLLSWAAAPGWVELCLMWPKRVGGIAATCAEAFRPYSAVLANLTGVCYWWGWVPTCGLTAILSASALHQWYLPGVPVPALACAIVVAFTVVNLCGVRWVTRLASPIAVVSASLAFLSCVVPAVTGHVDWHQAASWHLTTPFSGFLGGVTSAMAGLYLIGFGAPAFEAATCHVGEMRDPTRDLPRAVFASGVMAGVYFLLIPVIWLGLFGPVALEGDLAQVIGPSFAPLVGGAAKAFAIWFMMMNMFHGTLQPLAGAARTLMQLSEDGLLPRILALRIRRTDAPLVATLLTAGLAIAFLLAGDPTWLVAAANLTYLIGIALPNVAVWLLRRNAPEMERPWRAPRGTIVLGVLAALVWGISTVLGFEQFGLPTVIFGLAFAYSGSALYAWRGWSDRRRAGLRVSVRSMHLKLTGAMLAVLTLDGVGYLSALSHITARDDILITALRDIFVAVALLTISVGLVLPGMIAHASSELARAADHLAHGTLADLTRAMEALADGHLDRARARRDITPVVVHSRDEIGSMADNFNTMQSEVARAALALDAAREQLVRHRDHLEELVEQRTAALREANAALEAARQELGERAESFRLLFEANPHPMWVIEEGTLRFLAVNDTTVRRYGWCREEFLTMTALDIRPEEDIERFLEHMAGQAGVVSEGGIWRHRLRDGRIIEVEVSSSPLTFQGRRAWLLSVQDVTERRMLERELQAVNDQRHALLMRLVSAQEVERRRIAADIHDDAVQVMTAAKMRLDLLSRHLDDRQGEAARQLSGAVGLAIRRLRHLLFELTPPALEEHGLGTALRVLLEQSTEDTAIAWHLDCHLTAEPDRDAAVITYRVAQEAVVNVRKHSKARLVTVRVAHEDGGLRVRIADDGVGFSARTVGAAPGHLGLASMRERAQMAGGWLTLSSAPGSGTRIDFWVPAAVTTPEDEERELQLSEMAG